MFGSCARADRLLYVLARSCGTPVSIVVQAFVCTDNISGIHGIGGQSSFYLKCVAGGSQRLIPHQVPRQFSFLHGPFCYSGNAAGFITLPPLR